MKLSIRWKWACFWGSILSVFINVGCSPNPLITCLESKDYVTPGEISSEIIKNMESDNYEEVEQFFEYLVDKKPYSINGTRLLEEIYINLSTRRDLNKYLDAWYSSNTPHFSMLILDGMNLIRDGWRARGSDLGYTVTEKRGQLFRANLQEARQRLELAYKLNPDDPNSASSMILLCVGLGLHEANMEKWFNRAIKADPVSISPYSYKLNFLLPKWHGSIEKSASFAEYCYMSPPAGSIVYTVMFHYLTELSRKSISAEVFYEQRQVEKIVDDIFARWLKDFPNSSAAYENLAHLKFNTKKVSEALHNCNRSLDIDPLNAKVLKLRGIIYMRYFSQTKREAAEKDLKRATEIDPDNAEAFYWYGVLSMNSHGDHQKAIQLFDRAIALNDKDKNYFVDRGYAKMELNQYSSAIDDFSSAIALDPLLPGVYASRSECYRQLNLTEKAKLDSKTASELSASFKKRKSVPAITPQTAKQIVEGHKQVNLARIKTMTPEVAKELAAKKDFLILSGLEQISPEVAKILAERKGYLDLSGLKTISPKIAELFSTHEGKLHLNGVEDLCPEVAKHLSRNNGELSLSGVKSISVDSAEHLSKIPQGGLTLDGLESITPEVASHLKKVNGLLNLRGLKSITPEVAYHFGQRKGCLNLIGLASITPEVAASLGRCEGILILDGIKEIDAEIAKHLKKHKGSLSLNGLRYLTADAAKHFCEHEGSLSLRGLKQKEIDPTIMAHLKNHKGKVYLK